MPDIINHTRKRVTFGDPSKPGKDLIRIGSYDDRDHEDAENRNRKTVDVATLKALRSIPGFNARVTSGQISVYGE